ncbi:MAG: RelA/SpoT family protein [Bacteroidaceae bacterium]|nr:RelA/SpoT family protein [Bacteroidaceae bacterium]
MTEQELHDEELINAAAQRLFDTYMASNHRGKLDVIKKAFNFAKQAHKGVRRLSGEPYILHPIAVAQIACEEIGLGSTSVCAALLHDVVEDTEYTHEDLENLFGTKVANIVEGVTKISGGIFGDQASLQAETFKKMLLSMSDDIRVILIKISDRLHNMRTLASMRPSKQYKIAAETLYIFAPLADRLGLNRIKTELEDLSFRYEHPEEYATLVQQLHDSQMERDKTIDKFTPAIQEQLELLGVKFHIAARIKSPYSIWQKMQRKHIPFEEVFDILAIRIVFTPNNREHEIEECYRIYGALTRIYKPHPSRFRDWLSNPKANGYQALHNTFMSHEGKWIEVQIRSDRMDDEAEGGFAAHWKYKDPNAPYDETELDRWLNSIKEILDDPQPDTLDLLDTIKLNLFASEIMVFTPKGEIKTMPQGSTVLDFAFGIHSVLGSHCMGAKVNHKLMPLSYQLKSGDQIEILTTEKQHISPEWLNFVVTGKAKGKIQAILRRENREKQRQGEETLREFLTNSGVQITTAVYDRLALYHDQPSRQELFQAVAEQIVTPCEDDLLYLRGKKKKKDTSKSTGWRRFIPFLHSEEATKTVTLQSNKKVRNSTDFVRQINRKQVLQLNEDTLVHCQLSSCCAPIPGDDVLGYITHDHHLEIHQRSCAEAHKHKTRHGDNIIACSWDMHHQQLFDALLYIKGVDAQGVLHSIADVLQDLSQFRVKSISLTTNDGIFEGQMLIAVYSTDDIDAICAQLLSIQNVTKVVRI